MDSNKARALRGNLVTRLQGTHVSALSRIPKGFSGCQGTILGNPATCCTSLTITSTPSHDWTTSSTYKYQTRSLQSCRGVHDGPARSRRYIPRPGSRKSASVPTRHGIDG